MFHLISIGDPVIDTHVQIPEKSPDCRIVEDGEAILALRHGAKIAITDSFQALGGNAANVAVGAAKLGLSTALLTTVGDDSNGNMVLDTLKKHKVDTSLITREAGSETRYSVILNYKSERTILSYSEKKNYVWPEPIPAADWLYYSGLSEGYEAIQEHLLRYLEKHPTTRLAVNPGSYMLNHALPALREVTTKADVVIVNLQEAERIVEKKVSSEKTEAALLRDILALGAKEVVITDGVRGAWGGSLDAVWHMKPYPVKVIAKTGAGDAFSAGYIVARLHGHDIQVALEWGTAASAGVVQAHGPHAGLLDQKGIEKLIHKYPELTPVLLD